MNYYEIHVNIPKHSYSIGYATKEILSEEDLLDRLVKENKFEEKEDYEFVDYISEISRAEYKEWFNK